MTEELQRWSDPLVDLATTFSDIAPKFQITTFFEKQLTHGVMVSVLDKHLTGLGADNELIIRNQVVHQGSAHMNQQNERIRGLEADHISICKLEERDSNWQIVSSRFEAIAEEISAVRVIQNLPRVAYSNLEEQLRDTSLERRLHALNQPHRST